jgi:hypothetical protein
MDEKPSAVIETDRRGKPTAIILLDPYRRYPVVRQHDSDMGLLIALALSLGFWLLFWWLYLIYG